MSEVKTIPEFKDFKTFYKKAVEPLKKANMAHIRLDGKLKGGTRNVFAYFWYMDKKWRVNADTHIDRLKIAFDELATSDEPFVIKPTRDYKGESLSIKGQPIRNNKFYVYLVV
ncbi:hypothetical protein GM921_05790 [Pedobacter sp. LMG 31464]|uniref:Uncharacterized protein n=1 Tax=Pedobacter planticolens TaxID=2679964 RepID=A0A923DZU3_9SPHI|nr:hypothetical protein [Pedobacter planticolens]MBB2144984.1 hypothetical protein [Pedobacter planticolens]